MGNEQSAEPPPVWRFPTDAERAVVQRLIDERRKNRSIGEDPTDYSQLSNELASSRVSDPGNGWLDFEMAVGSRKEILSRPLISDARILGDQGVPIDFCLFVAIDTNHVAHLLYVEIVTYIDNFTHWPEPSELNFDY